MGSFTFRLAHALAAALRAMLPWVLLLAVVLAVGLPLTQAAVSYYVTGRAVLPAPVVASSAADGQLAVRGASPAEAAAIRDVVAALRYRLPPRAVTVLVVDNDPACQACGGEYVPYLELIKIRRDVIAAGSIVLSHAMAHEIGHYVDAHYLTDSVRQRYRELRGIPEALAWDAPGEPWARRPAEDFGEVFATLATPDPVLPIATAYGQLRDVDAYVALLGGVHVALGRELPPDGWMDVLRRESRLLAEFAAQPTIAPFLVGFIAVHLLYAGLPAGIASWREHDRDEGVPSGEERERLEGLRLAHHYRERWR